VCREIGNLKFLSIDAIPKPMPLDEKAFGAVGDAMTRRKQEGGLHCHPEMGGVITGFPPSRFLECCSKKNTPNSTHVTMC
jgi:hypothetical protein